MNGKNQKYEADHNLIKVEIQLELNSFDFQIKQ